MRELTLIETGYLGAGLVLALVLPVLMSFRGRRDAIRRASYMKIVWAGQACLTLGGLGVFASAPLAPWAAGFGLVGWMACVFFLVGRLRVARDS